jgi:hypothetical protein
MKVYFDDEGQLRHYGCDHYVSASVEAQYKKCPILNTDSDWEMGEFDAHVDIVGGKWDWGLVRTVECECGEQIRGDGPYPMNLELVVLEDEDDEVLCE